MWRHLYPLDGPKTSLVKRFICRSSMKEDYTGTLKLATHYFQLLTVGSRLQLLILFHSSVSSRLTSPAHHFPSVGGVKLSLLSFIGPPRTQSSSSESFSKFLPPFVSTEVADERDLRRRGRPADETISVTERGNIRSKVLTWSQSSAAEVSVSLT